ncbi:MAG: helix-hairpin-helix domain-containing protein [Marinifilaceae bacterium]|nr:helix-hairpin-helix domain-containing protein [Marinifilaceae bacterium]
MNRIITFTISLALLLSAPKLYAQVVNQTEGDSEAEWERLADELLEEGDETDYESWWQRLEETKLNPLNLNTVGFDSLKMLGLLSERQIENILQFRKDYGGFMNINELLLVNGIGLKQLGALRPLLYVDSPEYRQRIEAIKKGSKHETLFKMSGNLPQNDYLRNNRYPGAPFSTMLKYKASLHKRWSISLVAESDAGEKFFTNSQRGGFDFYSGHIGHKSDRVISQWVLGDFRMQWGQGLVLWQGFTSGGSSGISGIEKSAGGIAPYTSATEYDFFRGGAIAIQAAKNLSFQLFASYNKIDGKIITDTIGDEEDYTSSVYETGYHRTTVERAGKRQLGELAFGGAAIYNSSVARLQLHYLHYNLNPYLARGQQKYQQYNDTYRDKDVFGFSWKTSIKGALFFGELAINERGATALVTGLRHNFKPLNIGVLYHRYDKRYSGSYGAGYGAYSNTSNEEGVTLAIEASPSKQWQMRMAADYYHYFSARYNAELPHNGFKASGEIINNRVRWQNQLSVKFTAKPDQVAPKFKSRRNTLSTKLQSSFKIDKRFEVRARGQFTYTNKNQHKEYGYMVSADGIITLSDKFKTQVRVAYHNTDSYYSRIYLYENNVLYGYYTPSFQGEGWRTYINLNYKAFKGFTIYAKAGVSIRPEMAQTKYGDIIGQIRYTF